MDNRSSILQVQNIVKRFGDVTVLDHLNLSVDRGEFVTLLGASGCGKTTLLRIIAGLETPDEGTVLLSGQDVTDWAPNKRNVNTVFQNYALFPHMNVEANVGCGLRLKKMARPQIQKTVSEALALVQLPGYEKRHPQELSGGQRQRVAIARAIVNSPDVLLLDEPLGALDLQLRRQMQIELKRLQKQLGITFIYITHDQEEAINMSDRIAVMYGGTFAQTGTPAQIYDEPINDYVATFVGNSNIIRGVAEAADGSYIKASLPGGTLLARKGAVQAAAGTDVLIAVRSENIDLLPPEEAGLPAEVREVAFGGGMQRITLLLQDNSEIVASRHGIDSGLQAGDRVSVYWDKDKAIAVQKA